VKFSVFTLAFPGYTAEEAIEISKRVGFDGVDIRVHRDGHIYIDASKERRKQLLEYAKSYEIEFFGIYSYIGRGFVSPNYKIRERELKELSAHIDLALDLEGIYVRIFPGTYERSEENMTRFIECCKRACSEAEDKGVYIGIETHGELVWNAETCNRVLEEVNSDNLKIVFDPANIFRLGLNPAKEGELIPKDSIIAIQFHDFKKLNDKLRYTLLGKGDVPIDDVIKLIKEVRFDGFIVVEYEKWWHPEELPDPEIGLPHELKYLKDKLL